MHKDENLIYEYERKEACASTDLTEQLPDFGDPKGRKSSDTPLEVTYPSHNYIRSRKLPRSRPQREKIRSSPN